MPCETVKAVFIELSVEPTCQFIQPFPTEAEPTSGAYLLASETKDEIAVSHLLIRESGIDELEMGIAFFVGVGEGSPYCHCIRMKPCKSLAKTEREAKIGAVMRIHAERTANDSVPIFYQESTC